MSLILGDIQTAYYTAAQWSAWNGILKAGQRGIESDTLKEKVGDGVMVWNSLSYLSAPNYDLQAVLTAGNSSGNLSAKFGTGAVYFGATNQTHVTYNLGLELHNTTANKLVNLTDSGLWKVDATQYMPNLTASRLLSLDASKNVVNETGTGILTLNAGVISYDTNTYLTTGSAASTYLTIANAASTYQPLDSDLTSWSSVTRASGFDTFTATPSSANFASLLTDETGSGKVVFGTSPTFTADITTPKINGVSGNLLFANAAQTSGAVTNFTFTGSSNTGQTASVNIPTWQTNGVTQTRAAGTVATQYFNYWKANTLAFASSSTATNVYANYFETSLEGTSATFSNNYAIGTDGNIYARSAVNTRIIVSTTGTTSRAAFETEDDLGNVSRFATYGSAFSLTHFRGNGVLQATNDLYLIPSVGSSTGGTKSIYFLAGGNAATNQRLLIDSNGNTVQGTAALATNATNGFLYIETCAGTPTGAPTTYTGRIAMVYDTTNNKLYMYNGAWKSVTLA